MSTGERMTVDLSALFSLQGRRVLVVGAYGGLGKVLCDVFARHGASLTLAGRSLERAEELATHVRAAGTPAAAVCIDVALPASVAEGVAAAADAMGGIDVLVNLAGSVRPIPAEEITEKEWREQIDVNLTGAFWLAQAVGRRMIATGTGGSIIQFSSVRSMSGGRRGFVAYAAAKAGVNLMVKQLATEWASHAITVNAVAPGFVRTDITDELGNDPQFMNMVVRRTPLGRLAEPYEVCGAAVYLASPAASFVTGQILFVDGGVTASQ